jgi:hypothetical protein
MPCIVDGVPCSWAAPGICSACVEDTVFGVSEDQTGEPLVQLATEGECSALIRSMRAGAGL